MTADDLPESFALAFRKTEGGEWVEGFLVLPDDTERVLIQVAAQVVEADIHVLLELGIVFVRHYARIGAPEPEGVPDGVPLQ